MIEKAHPFPGNVLMHVENMGGSDSDNAAPDTPCTRFTETENLDAAMLLTSKFSELDGYHRPVIDIDLPVTVVESSPGKHHLMIDRDLGWGDYLHLLKAMAHVGLVEHGYVRASEARGFTAVRVPWFRKGDPAPDIDGNLPAVAA